MSFVCLRRTKISRAASERDGVVYTIGWPAVCQRAEAYMPPLPLKASFRDRVKTAALMRKTLIWFRRSGRKRARAGDFSTSRAPRSVSNKSKGAILPKLASGLDVTIPIPLHLS